MSGLGRDGIVRPTIIVPNSDYSSELWSCFKAVTPTSFGSQTSYAANGTNPTLLLRKANGKKRTTPVRLDISQTGTVAGGLITCVIKTDALDRLSPNTGNLWLIGNNDRNVLSSAQPEFTVLDNPTATAENGAGADPRTIFDGSIFQTVSALGVGFVYEFNGEVSIEQTGSLLIYIFSSTPGPTLRGTLTVLEE